MPNNPFNNTEESSFEQGISVNKPAKAVSAQAAQQAKNITRDIVAQLYGISDKSSGDPTDPNAQDPSQPKAPSPAPPPKQVHKLGGMSDSGDHAKYAAMQAQLEAGDKKGADDTMHHMQYYYDTTIGTLEEQVKKAHQKKQQEEQEKSKEEQEEGERKQQELEQKNADLPRPTAKGRNRMGTGGKKAKTDMGLKMGQMKTETFRGSSG